jgi:hypothetical protein
MRGISSDSELKKVKKDQAKKMGWMNPPTVFAALIAACSFFSEARIVLCKHHAGKRLCLQDIKLVRKSATAF